MSQIKVNSIIPVGGVATGQGGGIIQTIQESTTTLVSTTSTSAVDSTLSASITPTSTNRSFQTIQSTRTSTAPRNLR